MSERERYLEIREPLGRVEDNEPMIDESPEGVDRTLIHHMLSLSPTDRLRMLQGFAHSVWAIRNGRRPPA